MSFWCLQISQKINEIFSRIAANWTILIWLSYTTFLIWPIWQKSWKQFRYFLGDLKTSKGDFKFNWPLAGAFFCLLRISNLSVSKHSINHPSLRKHFWPSQNNWSLRTKISCKWFQVESSISRITIDGLTGLGPSPHQNLIACC